MNTILSPLEGNPVGFDNSRGQSQVLLICEHASRKIPEKLGALGLDELVCQRRSKNRPRGGAKVGHYGAGLRPPGGRSPSGGLRPARRFFE